MNKNRRKPDDPTVQSEARPKSRALFGKKSPSDESLAGTGARPKIATQDGLADHQRNPLAPPITITANS